MITQNNIKYLLVITIVAVIITMSTDIGSAYAHMSFRIVPGNGNFSGGVTSTNPATAPTNGNHTVKIVVGETYEPAYPGDFHDLEMRITHELNNIGVGTASRDTTRQAFIDGDFSGTTKVLKIDTYFYPQTALVNSAGALVGKAANSVTGTTAGIKPSTSTLDDANAAGLVCANGATITSGVMSGNAYNCVPKAGGTYGYTDSRAGGFARAISVAEVASGTNMEGLFRQNTRQYYTQQGLTLYHIYGQFNYFNDTNIGKTNINLWTDGKNIKTLSISGRSNAAGGTGTQNRTYTISSGYGLGNFTTAVAWPDHDGGTNENTYPWDMRAAIGQTRDATFDIWNVLEEITDALRTIVGFGTVQDHVPRNSTNSAITSKYTYP